MTGSKESESFTSSLPKLSLHTLGNLIDKIKERKLQRMIQNKSLSGYDNILEKLEFAFKIKKQLMRQEALEENSVLFTKK